MPQQITRKGKQQSSLQQTVSTPVVVLAVVVVAVFLLFLFDRFITPIVPRTGRMSDEEAWNKRLREMQQAMPQGGWASPAPGMPPVYVPPAGQPVAPPSSR